MSGMDIMFKSLLNSMGFNPEELRAKFLTVADEVRATVEHFDKRLTAIEKTQSDIATQLALITEFLQKEQENEHNGTDSGNSTASAKPGNFNGKSIDFPACIGDGSEC